jgi:hypothetical protein
MTVPEPPLWPPDDWPVKPVIARPRCAYCTNRDSVIEGLTTLSGEVYACLCDPCWELIGEPGTGHMLVHAAEQDHHLPRKRDVLRYIAAQEWTMARSRNHEYVLLHRSTAPWMHLRVLAYIRRRGEGRWWSWPRGLHFYWQPGDGFEYWTLASQQVILNRQPVPDATEVESEA